MSMPADPATDPLWDPRVPGDEELRQLERLLAPYAAARQPALLEPPRVQPPVRMGRRRWLLGLAMAATLLLSLWGAHHHRLAWPEGQPWPLRSGAEQRLLAPGERLQTGAHEHAELSVARIGSLRIAPHSTLTLIESRSGRHRIELTHGRVQARIWAPPGYFAIDSGTMRVVDLGCEFILERHRDGSGQLHVLSGWVQQHLGGQDCADPAGHALDFTADSAGTALRDDAPPALRAAVAALDQALLRQADADTISQRAAEVARTARDADQYTLMSLLLRDRSLAAGPLYPRLAQALGVPADDAAHRADWIKGDHAAVNLWWQHLPSQPKRWWAHWRDGF
ncbi:MAG: FecR domain-containing protein [Lysobacterales bacterium]